MRPFLTQLLLQRAPRSLTVHRLGGPRRETARAGGRGSDALGKALDLTCSSDPRVPATDAPPGE